MMDTLRVEVVQSPQPANWSLSVLTGKMRAGPPPVLSELLSHFTDVEVMSGFLELIMRYLPGHETDILAERGNARLYRFCRLFEERYFPLPAGTSNQQLGDFVQAMPVTLMGMSYGAYHELGMRPGYILLLSLLVYPYEGDERDDQDDRVPFDPFDPMKKLTQEIDNENYKPSRSDIKWLKDLVAGLAVGGQWIAPMGFTVVKTAENSIELKDAANTPEVKEVVRRTLVIAERLGFKTKFERTGRTAAEKTNGARVALLDAARQIVGETTAKRILTRGWDRKHLHKLTDGTLYDGVGTFADWVFGKTGCVVLDYNYEHCFYTEGQTEPIFRWSEHNIKLLAKQWTMVRQLREKIDNLVEFIEGDPVARFGELLDLVSSRKPTKHARETARIYPENMDGIPLDQGELSEEETIDE